MASNDAKNKSKAIVNSRNQLIKANKPDIEKPFKELNEEVKEFDETAPLDKQIDDSVDIFSINMKVAYEKTTTRTISSSFEFLEELYDIEDQLNPFLELDSIYIQEYLEKHGAEFVKGVSDTTRDSMNLTLKNGAENGLSSREIIKELEKQTEKMTKGRARTIYRTETHAAYSDTNNNLIVAVELDKEWVHVGGGLTDRESHVALDGEVVAFDETFSNGMLYPHDPNADISEVINCYCTHVGVVNLGKKE
jgi:hypothetical protein